MDSIDKRVYEKLNERQNYTPKRGLRNLPNGNTFHYNYNYENYTLRNQYGVLLHCFGKDYIDSMNDEEFIEFLVDCSEDHR